MKVISCCFMLLVAVSATDPSLAWVDEAKRQMSEYGRRLQGGPPGGGPPIPPGPLGVHMASILSQVPVIAPYETPLAIRWTSLIDVVFWNCVASFSTTYNDGLTKRRPIVNSVPAAMHTVDNKLACGLNAFAVFSTLALPAGVEPLKKQTTDLGFTLKFDQLPEVEACLDGPEINRKTCLNSVATAASHNPEVVGNIVGQLVVEYAFADGWNQLGTDDCTANCRPFADTTGYETFPIRRSGPRIFKWGRPPWQQLVETDGRGFFYQQEHVTPHIGKKGKSRFLIEADRKSRKLPLQTYNLRKEVSLVLKRMSKLDDKRKMEIEFHDNKLQIAIFAYISFLQTYRPDFDTALRFLTAYTAGEYEGSMVVWGEKVRQNLIRPTTVIKWEGARKITTWAGPGQGVKEFESKDFEAYIRVMPHAEFPSGSSCLCTVVDEYVSSFLAELSGKPNNPLPVVVPYKAGSSTVEPGFTPAQDILIMYANISEVAANCASTRVDGGMHFTAAVPGGKKLCAGIGIQGYRYSRVLVGKY